MSLDSRLNSSKFGTEIKIAISKGSVGLFGALLIVIPNLGYLPFTNDSPADEEKDIVQLQAKKLIE